MEEHTTIATATVHQNPGASRGRVVDSFVSAWNTTDEMELLGLLEQCWAKDGVLITPDRRIEGRQAMATFIEEVTSGWEGGHVRISAVEEHPGGLRYTWTIFRHDGSPRAQGMHVAERSSDGRLQKMIAFYGPCPEVGGA